VLSDLTPGSAPTTHTSLEATAKPAKPARNAVGGHDFKAIQPELTPVTDAACNYTESPEVKPDDRLKKEGPIAVTA